MKAVLKVSLLGIMALLVLGYSQSMRAEELSKSTIGQMRGLIAFKYRIESGAWVIEVRNDNPYDCSYSCILNGKTYNGPVESHKTDQTEILDNDVNLINFRFIRVVDRRK